MNSKEINKIIKFRKKNGHYPSHIHLTLSGGNLLDDIKHGFEGLGDKITGVGKKIVSGLETFGDDIKTGLGVVGNFVKDHQDVFISAAVTGSLMVVFPEFAPEIAMMGTQNLLGKVLAAAPPGSAVPTQADIDAALAAYKADPRYQQMMDRASNFLKTFTNYVKNEAPTRIPNYSGTDTAVWTRPTSVTMGGSGVPEGTIQINYKYWGGDCCFPIQIQMEGHADDLMNYSIPICNAGTMDSGIRIEFSNRGITYLNADGSNYRDLLNIDFSNATTILSVNHGR